MKRKLLAVALGVMMVAPVAMAQGDAKEIKAKVVKRKDAGATETEAAAAKTETAATSDEQKMVCSNGNLERHVEVEYDDPTTKVPCKVHYRKTSEDPQHHQILWTANSDAEFCQTKAQEFVAKLEGWGWSCQAGK